MVLTPEAAARIFEGRVYLIRIKIGQPCGKWFNLKELRSGDQLTEAIKSNRGSTVDRIPLFEVVGDDDKPVFNAGQSYTAVNTVLDSIQERFMEAAGEGKAWFCPESKIEKLEAAIEGELKDARDEQLELILANYDEAQELFHARLKDVLEAAKLDDKFWEFANKFPSKQEIETSFIVETIQWERMKTLEEIQEESAKDKFVAKGAEVVKGMINAFRVKAPSAMDAIYEQSAAALNDVEGLSGKPSEAMIDRMSKRLEIIETKISLLASFGEVEGTIAYLHHAVQSICHAVESESGWVDAIKDIVDETSTKLADFVPTTGSGAQALHNWLHPEKSIEPELKAAIASLESCEDEGEKKALDRKVKKLRKLLSLQLQRSRSLLGEDGIVEVQAETIAEAEPEPEVEPEAIGIDLRECNRDSLRKLCQEKGIDWRRKGGKVMTKDEMIAALSGRHGDEAGTLEDVDPGF